jgi:hypothetical protein
LLHETAAARQIPARMMLNVFIDLNIKLLFQPKIESFK